MTTPTLGKLESGGPLHLDVERLAAGRLLVSAQSGAGKSWLLRRLLEQTHGLIPQIIIDREGEFYTLRERGDYLLAGGDGGDCPADPRSASLLARKILELRLSAIVDIEPLPGPQRFEFVRRFLEGLVNAPKRLRHPALVVLDEADQFAPQAGKPECRQKVIELASLGRKRGLVGCFATQRLAKLSKDVAAECANRIIGRTTLDTDAARALDELGMGKEGRTALRRLGEGQFYAYGPALSQDVVLVQVGDVRTTHPRPGQPVPPTPPPRAAVEKALAELADLPEQAAGEARTLEEARREVKVLKRQVRELEKSGGPPDEQALERARAEGRRETGQEVGEIERRLRGLVATVNARHGEAARALDRAVSDVGKALDALREPLDVELPKSRPTEDRNPPSTPTSRREIRPPARVSADAPRRSGGEARMLAVLAQYHPRGLPVAQWATLSRLKRTGGTWGQYLSRLRTRGHIEERGGLFYATEDGVEVAGVVSELPTTTKGVLEMWASKPGMGPAVRLVAIVVDHPDGITREELAERAGLTHGAGTFGAYLSRAKTAGLVTVDRGCVRPTEAVLL